MEDEGESHFVDIDFLSPLFVSVYKASCGVCKHGDILLSQYNTRTINFISIYYSMRLCRRDPIMR